MNPWGDWYADAVGDDAPALDGMDTALMGYVERADMGAGALAYDRRAVFELLVRDQGMLPEDAEEYLSFNILGGYLGEQSPVLFTPAPELASAAELGRAYLLWLDRAKARVRDGSPDLALAAAWERLEAAIANYRATVAR